MKIYKLELAITSNIPIIIQGFTSAGKSYLSKFALNLNKRKYDTVVLSEYTTQEDLLGRDSIDNKNNSINFSPGILLNAYIEGKTVILDECDLAKPEILSCIIGTITKDELIIRKKTYWKNENYNVILTMNGESKGFNEKQRNILTSNILSKFIIIYFEEIDKKESEEIFESLLEGSENYKNKNQDEKNIIKSTFIEIHERMMKKNHETIDPIVTLRNLKNYIYFDRSQIPPRVAAEISYTARFPKKERESFEDLLNKLGAFEINEEKKKKILEYINKENLVYDEEHKNIIIRVIYLALIACEEGFHPLLIGKEGSGLTKLAKIIASIYNKDNYEYLLCNSETSDEDLIGNYQPDTNGNNENKQSLSSLIHWREGSVLKALKEGKPVILDDINYSRAQIIESLNSLLELNIKYTKNYKYIILQKGEDNEVLINGKNNFIIIGTMKYENTTNISKALMNRFVSIYLDEIKINQNNADLIITKTIENINDDQKNKFKSILSNDGFNGNLKTIIKKLKKLDFLYNKIEKYHFTLEDCNNFLNLNFDNFNYKRNDIENLLCLKIKDLKNSQKNNTFFFFDKNDDNYSENNEALKMIIGIIISDLLNRTIFIQGCPGSGKSCAAKFYGANRNKNSRDPIISINCHRDLSFDSLIGNYSFKNQKFEFVEGPLLTAMKNGEVFLLDEFNLCSENILANLCPILKADFGEEIKIKGVPYPIKIKEGFLIIATGNFQNEKGRRKIPNYILNEIKVLKVKSSELNFNALDKLMKEKYKDLLLKDEIEESKKNYLISIEQIKEICNVLSDTIQEKFSLRQIKCLLERIKRFTIESVGGKIEVIYIIICYIIPQFNIEKENALLLLEKFNKIMKYNNLEELKQFLCSEVRIYDEIDGKGKFIKKGKISLTTSLELEELPQVCLQVYFWIRMSCNYDNDSPSEENLLLIGNTSYKEYILNKWLKSKSRKCETYYLTKNTEVQDLIGISSLDDDKKLEELNQRLNDESKENLFGIELDKFDKSCIREEYKDCIIYLHECYDKIKSLSDCLKNELYLKSITSFHPRIITLSYIFGKTLILKGIENPQPSVIERLNSILEIPRNLELIEDNQKIFNDKDIFNKVYENKNKTSIPLNKDFSLIFTSRNAFNKSFSKAFISRCTLIQCPSYKDKIYLTINFDIEKNYLDISKNILSENKLENEIINLKKELNREIEILSFIRWCKTTKNIYKSIIKYKEVYLCKSNTLYSIEGINYKYIVGISALRSIIDKYDLEERKSIVSQYFKNYLPKNLYNIILNNPFNENPFDEFEYNNEKYIISKYSEIILKVNRLNNNYLENIIWTNSSIDISDALLISLISNTILVLEGPPGRGKTAISKCIFDYLNIETTRINFSPSTTKEDIFSRITPKIGKDNILTENENKQLLIVLEKSKGKNEYYENGLILDEINLSKDELLEDLYSYLMKIKSEQKIYTTEGKKFTEYGNIGVVVTMNGSNMSNSRTSLSSSFLQLCHSFKLSDYTKDEKDLLIEKILNGYIGKNDINYISTYISKNKNYSFREVIKLSKIFEKIKNIDFEKKLNLILEPEKNLDLKDLKLKKDNNNLCFGDYVKYPLNKKNNNQELIKQFTYSQKEAIFRIMIGLTIEKTILLTGEIGIGKTFIIEELAKLIGANLKIIQFNYETTSNDLIGRLELNRKNLDDLKNSLDEIQELLITNEYEFITKFIELNNSMEISKISEFLNNKKYSFKEFAKKIEALERKKNELELKLNNLTLINNINFGFNFSILINAMKNGEWVLLDDINFAPHEIERLMSLLEEEPTLTVYETEPTLIYKRNNTNQNENIHENFRLFITSSNENVISSAVKSRCFHIKLKSFQDPEDYAILISNYLNNTGINKENIKEISSFIGNAFYFLKKEENQSNYLLKNYILTPINLVNFCKLITNYDIRYNNSSKIDGINLARFIEYSIFSAFKEKKSNEIILFKNKLKKINLINFELIQNKKLCYDYYLSTCEIYIISYYLKYNYNEENNKEEFINQRINKIIEEKTHKRSNIRSDKINLDINEALIIEEMKKIRNILINGLFSLTFKQIKNYSEDINEVIAIFKSFIKAEQNLFKYFYFLIYLKQSLDIIKDIYEDNLFCDLELNKFDKTINEKKYAEKMYNFRNMLNLFNDLIPSEIDIGSLEEKIIFLFYKYYFRPEKKKINIYFDMLSHKSLRPLLRKYEIKFPENEKAEKLFNNLLNFENEIEVKKENEEIIITLEKYGKMYLNNISIKSLNDSKIYVKKNLDHQPKKNINEFNYLDFSYDYPSIFYNDKNLCKIFWFLRRFIIEKNIQIDDIKDIISPEIYYFNEGINRIISKNESNEGKEICGDIKHNIELGYKFFEGIRDIKENDIKFNEGLNLFKNGDEIDKIEFALNVYNDFEKFFYNNNSKKLWDEIKKKIDNKINILEKKKKNIISQNKKKLFEEKYKELQSKFIIFEHYFANIDCKFSNLEQNILNFDKSNDNINIGNEIEVSISELEKNINDLEKYNKKMGENKSSSKIIIFEQSNEPPSINANILYNYSRLCSIIEKMEMNINNSFEENLLFQFNIITKIQYLDRRIKGKLKCKNENIKITPELIEFFKRTSNYYLIKEISNKKDFINYCENIVLLKYDIIDLSKQFKEDEFIYLPIFSIKDLNQYIYFKFGDVEDFFPKNGNIEEQISQYQKKNIANKDNFQKDKNGIIELYKIDLENIITNFNNNDFDWLILPIEKLKGISLKNPNKLLIKKRYNLNFEEKKNIIDGRKLNAKALYSIYECKNPGKTKDWKTFPSSNIYELSNPNKFLNKNINYGYRVMELYDDFKEFRDYASETMIIIIDSLEYIFLDIFKEYNIPEEIKKLICEIYEELVKYIISEKNPNFENSKITYIIQYIFFIIVRKYHYMYKTEKKNYEENIANKISKELIIQIKNIYNNAKNKIKNNQDEYNKSKEEYDKYIDQEYNHKKKLFLENNVYLNLNENSYKFNALFENSKYYNYYLKNIADKYKPKEENWEEQRIIFESINNVFETIKNKNNSEIKDILKKNNLNQLADSKLVDKTEYENYIRLKNEIIEDIQKLNVLEKSKLNFNVEDIYKFQIIQENEFSKKDISDNYKSNYKEVMAEWINNFKKYNFNVFEIGDFVETKIIDKNDYTLSNDLKEYAKIVNFIFIKDNKSIFLSNYMKIYLGIYIIDNEYDDIGSTIIQNNSIKNIQYELKEKRNEIIIPENLNAKKNLEPLQDLFLNFRINKKKLNGRFGFFKSQFELIINNNEDKESKCLIDVSINVVPLILKFSLNNEKFSLKENNIYIHRYIEHLKISYEFPGNYIPKLRVLLEINDKSKILIPDKDSAKTQGNINLISNFEVGSFQRYNLSLYLKKKLFNLNVDCEKPPKSGLIIFDESKEILNEENKENKTGKVRIKLGEEKEINIFNMTYTKKKLNIESEKNLIKINGKKEIEIGKMINLDFENIEIKPGQLIVLYINNVNCSTETSIKINNMFIKVENIDLKLKYDENEIYCTLNNKSINGWNNDDLYDIQDYKLYLISNFFEINIKNINESKNNYFSAYLINKNKIIDKKINEEYNYELPQENDKVFGFYQDEFSYSEAKNMKIILSWKKNNTVFRKEERVKFKEVIKDCDDFLNKVKSENKKNIYDDISFFLLLIKDINLEIPLEENIKNLEISNDKTSYINIIKYLLKFSLSLSEEAFKKYLNDIFEKMYSFREINDYFEFKEKNIFLKKLGYIISFIYLCICPGEILETEIKEEKSNKSLHLDEYKEIYKRYFKTSVDQDKLNSCFIYYNGSISLDDKEFKIFEDQINNRNDENSIQIITQEEFFDCPNEINEIESNIKEKKINYSNLLLSLDKFKKYIISIPFILSKKERQEQCIKGANTIYEFICLLKKSNIYKFTLFNKKIDEYFEMFEKFLAKYKILDIQSINKNNNLKYISECRLPSDDGKWRVIEKYFKNSYNDEDEHLGHNNFEFTENKYNKEAKKKEITPIFNQNNKESKINKLRNKNLKVINNILDDEKKENKQIYNKPIYKCIIPKEETSKEIDYSKEINIESKIKDSELPSNIKNENFRIDQVKNSFEKMNSATAMLRFLINLTENNKKANIENHKKFGAIRKEEEILECYLKIDKELPNGSIDDTFIKASLLIQHIISNYIRENNIENIDNKRIYSFDNSYIDILVDISQQMTEKQEISALILCIGLCKSLTKYGVQIRISVFGERNNVWLLSKNFDNEKSINKQILRLRDALSCKQKRLMSFPADALLKLKSCSKNIINSESKYIQVLISSLITAQVVDDEIDWDEIHENIFIFTLKSEFEEKFIKKILEKNLKIEDNLLNVQYSSKNIPRSKNITQEFFSPNYLNENSIHENQKEEEKYKNIISAIIQSIKCINNGNKNLSERLPKENQYSITDMNNKEIINEDLWKYIEKLNKNDKYFAQNRLIFNSKEEKEEIINELSNHKFPDPEFLNQNLSKSYKNRNIGILGKIIEFDKKYIGSSLNNSIEKNISSGKIFSSSGGNISIKGIKRWICSGFTDTNIFEKKGGRDKRKYSLTFIIDLSKSFVLEFNYSHAIATIVLVLALPSIIENNDEIFIDIIINSFEGVRIIDYNAKCNDFQIFEKMNEILNIIEDNVNNTCCPGTSLYTAYRLLSEKREDKKIFLITDGYITNKYEIDLTFDLINIFESEGIDLIAIGVGSYPNKLDKIFPKFFYSPSFRKLYECLSICLNNSLIIPSENIESSLILTDHIKYDELLNFKNDKVYDEELKNDIENKEIYLYNMIFNNINYKEVDAIKEVVNPEEEPYQNIFNTFASDPVRILVVILYLGGDKCEGHMTKDEQITEEVFNKFTGKILKEKGFSYTLVYNYIDAIKELTAEENGHCKYFETWIFCSDGSGDTPKGGKKIYYSDQNQNDKNVIKVNKEDNEKQIIPFLETVSAFNKNGGALLLFCDNEPFVLEANLLLTEYLNFEETKNGSANFKMGGNYVRNRSINPNITVYNSTKKWSRIGTFKNEDIIKTPGFKERYSLRIGITKFFEGETLSYAKKNDINSNYEPFTPFAYLTDPNEEKPFILYYDPKIKENGQSRGPIVVHGGFTSAFYEFENEGTGRLVISIACWLIRVEERLESLKGIFNEKYVPVIKESQSKIVFDKWINKLSAYTIFILDVSGSMRNEYNSLVEMTNNIIKSQKEKEDNEGIIIFFSTNSKTIRKGKYSQLYNNQLNINELTHNNLGGGTNFLSGFEEATKYIYPKEEFISKRVIFLTDGMDSNFMDVENICKEMRYNNFKLIFLGFDKGSNNGFKNLEKLPHDYMSVNKSFKEIEDIIYKQFAT